MTLIYIMGVSLVAVLMTRHCIQKRNLSAIRASTALTLSFVALTSFFVSPLIPTLQAGFFGATFVGMTEADKLTTKALCLAALLFSFVFFFLIPHSHGLGGALGCGAFLSCLIIHGSIKFFNLCKK